MILDRIKLWFKLRFSKELREYSQIIGAKNMSSFYLIHNLNTNNLFVKVLDRYNYKEKEVKITIMNENTVCISFDKPPAKDQYKVFIIG